MGPEDRDVRWRPQSSGNAAAPSDACRKIDAAWVARKTGLVPDAYFSATKIQWILEHSPEARAMAKDGEALFGTVDTWLIWKLTNGAVHVTDKTNASRTMLMDLATAEWDAELLSYFDIPARHAAAHRGLMRSCRRQRPVSIWAGRYRSQASPAISRPLSPAKHVFAPG